MVEQGAVNAKVVGSSPTAGANSSMYVVYILVGLQKAEFYVGHTNSLIRRYRYHAEGQNNSTKRLCPHVVGHVECFPTRGLAMLREKQLKQHAGRIWIRGTILPQVRLDYAGKAQW